MKRHASKKQRIPKWLNDDEIWMIEQTYEISALRTKMLGIEHHVDHIIPLQGKLVSGLHVPWNLQVITAQENRRKSNRLQGV
jgi:5-methylcytosine-specific restriction endonuclease McrA